MKMYDDTKTRSRNRHKIVEVARKLFIENGIAQTTVMDIVRGSEMERKTFYNYFNDKEEIAEYIYYFALEEFYREGFTLEEYDSCDSGFEKIQKYYTTIVEHFEKHSQEMLYLVHYDYYFRKNPSSKLVKIVYENMKVKEPIELFLEGVEDGSIDVKEENPNALFHLIDQSLGSYASRLILRGYKNGIEDVEIDFTSLYDLLRIHLKEIKA